MEEYGGMRGMYTPGDSWMYGGMYECMGAYEYGGIQTPPQV